MKKTLMILALGFASISISVVACVFTIKNDSGKREDGFKYIYISLNPNLADTIQGETLESESKKFNAQVYKVAKNKSVKTAETKWFVVYTPVNNNFYKKHYYVKMNFCGKTSKDNMLTYEQIQADAINAIGNNKGRFEITDYMHKPLPKTGYIEKSMPEQPAYFIAPGGYRQILP